MQEFELSDRKLALLVHQKEAKCQEFISFDSDSKKYEAKFEEIKQQSLASRQIPRPLSIKSIA
jgi:hypothetical protein